LILEGIALEMVGLSSRLGAARESDRAPRWLEDVRETIHEAVRSGAAVPRLDDLGRNAGRHPVYVARAFRQRFGEAIGAYARRLRVEGARIALARGTSLAAVAARAGFADQSHLSRVFRRYVGCSPAEFRRQTIGSGF
jgi:AraC-like DNA-binding protein